ncbi:MULTISPECIES: type I restriction-modification enzyme R subunit C-terminal domain-containing protein [unclassified Aeromonas]|uniref:type I restriction-modification enzyme R subunit C-terminal domain-containing protein n=1 Tax=unclassified Aeromonas TaxID=257493 RepID=UPI002159D12F|nr:MULTISPECIES: type I restriction-modification enzyme R subunit C-terminal domain-containing protein [unclassified Aeromonas]
MQKVIEAEQSDLFDVQAYVAYADDPMTREERAAQNKSMLGQEFDSKQLSFLSFALGHYPKERVTELDDTKRGPLLKLKYNNVLAVPLPSWGLLMLCAEPLSASRSIYQGQ